MSILFFFVWLISLLVALWLIYRFAPAEFKVPLYCVVAFVWGLWILSGTSVWAEITKARI